MHYMRALQIVTAAFVGIAVITAVAHALELPGKLRLPRDTYFAVQQIYYPGFTVAGFAEPAAVVAALILVFVTPYASRAFWLAVVTLVAMAAMQVVFWLVTQPANRHWLHDRELGSAAQRFFSLEHARIARDWRVLRVRWEYSHLARAVLSVIGLIALLVAIASDGVPAC